MQVPIFKAKDLDSDNIVEGYYFNYPPTTFAPPSNGSGEIMQGIIHCIITHQLEKTGFTNTPVYYHIDLQTLEFVKFIDIPCQSDRIIL